MELRANRSFLRIVGTSVLAGDTVGAQERTYWKDSYENVAGFIRTSSWSAAQRKRFSGVGEIRYTGYVFTRARSSPNIRSCQSMARGGQFPCRSATSARRDLDYSSTTTLTLDLRRRSGRPKFRRQRWRKPWPLTRISGTHPRFHRWSTIIPRPRWRQSLAGGIEPYSRIVHLGPRKSWKSSA